MSEAILPEGVSTRKPPPALQRWAVNGFVLFYAYAAIVMAIPPAGAAIEEPLLRPILPLVNVLGLYHRLRLFSPEPPKFTGYVRFLVGFPNGISYRWDYPRSVLMPFDPPGSFNRYLFNYVFWSYGNRSRLSLPALARYVAERNTSMGRHPNEVRIVEEVARILPPAQGAGRPIPPLDHQIVVCDYDVTTGQASFAERVPFW